MNEKSLNEQVDAAVVPVLCSRPTRSGEEEMLKVLRSTHPEVGGAVLSSVLHSAWTVPSVSRESRNHVQPL